jgi:peptidoglycan/xylan/chitin deacetylase (PgdA/CDA1 family)
MFVHPETLELHLEYLQRRLDIVPLSSLAQRADSGVRDAASRPRCALTFDDGWHDFYQHAYPILLRRQVPATVFLPTDFIGTDRWFWTDRLGVLLRHLPPSDVLGIHAQTGNRVVATILALRGDFEARLERAIDTLKPFRLDAINETLEELDELAGKSSMPLGRAFLSWREAEEMFSSGLITFGSHTASHPILTTLTEREVERELSTSRDALLARRVVEPGFLPFCFPNGTFSSRVSELVRGAGYHLAVTTQRGWNGPGADPYALRRIGLHDDMASTEPMFAARLVGLL